MLRFFPWIVFLLVQVPALAQVTPSKNKEQFLSPKQLIIRRGYPAEEHTVVTPDGYILTLHRIPNAPNGRIRGAPILLQHGLMSSSFDFLSPPSNQTLSYLLADAGYDVWIGNSRGNIYSNRHLKYTKSDPRYWDFTWEEMSTYDYPTIINYILKTAKQPYLYVIGHSQGALTFITSTISQPQLRQKVKYFFGLAPALSSLHMGKGAKVILLGMADEAKDGGSTDQIYLSTVLQNICGSGYQKDWCYDLYHKFSGPLKQVDRDQLTLVTSHYPAGTSNKNIKHWKQQIQNGTRYYDFGTRGNIAAYGTTYPREINWSAYAVPSSFYFSPVDKLVSTKDMKIALSQLPPSTILKKRNLTRFGHFEFIWGKRAKAEIYDEIISDLNKIESDQRIAPKVTRNSSL